VARAGEDLAKASQSIPGQSVNGLPTTSALDVVVDAFHGIWPSLFH
jgi:hypothetical protein